MYSGGYDVSRTYYVCKGLELMEIIHDLQNFLPNLAFTPKMNQQKMRMNAKLASDFLGFFPLQLYSDSKFNMEFKNGKSKTESNQEKNHI